MKKVLFNIICSQNEPDFGVGAVSYKILYIHLLNSAFSNLRDSIPNAVL